MGTTSRSVFNTDDVNYQVTKYEKDYSAIGIKYTMTLAGDRTALDTAALAIMQDGSPLSSIDGIPSTIAENIPDGALIRTPKLIWDGKGQMAELILIAEDGLNEGDTVVSGTDESGDTYMPANVTSRLIFEPNDTTLAYGIPFRAGFKWDLTVAANGVLAMSDDFADVASLIDSINIDSSSITWLGIINLYQTGAITEAQRGTLFSYLTAEDATGAKDWMTRYLRGQTSFRYWVPNVTLTKRYRTVPLGDNIPDPGLIATDPSDPNYPPDFTGAPQNDPYFNDYIYWAGATQLDFVGEFWCVERQWTGFVDFDTDLYGDPTAE